MFRSPHSSFEILAEARRQIFQLEAEHDEARNKAATTTGQRNIEVVKGIGCAGMAVAGVYLYDDAQAFFANTPLENVDGFLMGTGIALASVYSLCNFTLAGAIHRLLRSQEKVIKNHMELGETLTNLGQLPTPEWIAKEQ